MVVRVEDLSLSCLSIAVAQQLRSHGRFYSLVRNALPIKDEGLQSPLFS